VSELTWLITGSSRGFGRALAVALDVTDQAAVRLALDAAVDKFGRIDVVVNNAGYANVAPVETGPEEDFRRQFDTNFWGVYNVSRAALPLLRSFGGGTIIQFSSIGGRVGGSAGIGSYQAAKFAVDGLTRVLAGEILVRLVRRRDLPLHLVLGAGAVQMAQNYSQSQLAEADAWAEVSRSADFGQAYPAEFPAEPQTSPAS
jgi:NAD(P)-dependent dehydrogenase (short-subunit alcohol dehydrogenase family)